MPTRATAILLLPSILLVASCTLPVTREDTAAGRRLLAEAGVEDGLIEAAFARVEAKVQANEERTDEIANKVKSVLPQPWGDLIAGAGAVAASVFYAKKKAESAAREEAERVDKNRDLRRMARGEEFSVALDGGQVMSRARVAPVPSAAAAASQSSPTA